MSIHNVYSTPPWEDEPEDTLEKDGDDEVSIDISPSGKMKASQITEMADFILAQPKLDKWDEDFAENMKYQYASSASDKQIDRVSTLCRKYRERAARKARSGGADQIDPKTEIAEQPAPHPGYIQFPVDVLHVLRREGSMSTRLSWVLQKRRHHQTRSLMRSCQSLLLMTLPPSQSREDAARGRRFSRQVWKWRE
jgi:hypothetical protein